MQVQNDILAGAIYRFIKGQLDGFIRMLNFELFVLVHGPFEVE